MPPGPLERPERQVAERPLSHRRRNRPGKHLFEPDFPPPILHLRAPFPCFLDVVFESPNPDATVLALTPGMWKISSLLHSALSKWARGQSDAWGTGLVARLVHPPHPANSQRRRDRVLPRSGARKGVARRSGRERPRRRCLRPRGSTAPLRSAVRAAAQGGGRHRRS